MLLLVVIVATLLLLLLAPAADARHGLCIEGSFGPFPFARPPVDIEPVDVTFHDEPDFQQRLVSYGGSLHVTWLTEEEDPQVTEYLFMRTLGPEGWGPKVVVNNPVPDEGEFKGVDIRVAGYETVVHGGHLWFLWSTPTVEQADGPDGDIVYRTFDGTAWGPITEITPTGDEAIDITPTAASTGDRLVVAWATSTNAGRRIVTRWLEDGKWSDIAPVTIYEDGGDDFNPRVAAVPGGAFIAWHHRDPALEDPTQVTLMARVLVGDDLGPTFPITGTSGFEDIWVDLRWHSDRLMIIWQRAGKPLGFESSQIIYREWAEDGFGPEEDITGAAGGGFNGRPRIGLTDEGPRVYWHTDDDGVSLGTSEDLVWRGLGPDGQWGPVTLYRGDMTQDMVRVKLAEHQGRLWATWMGNVTFIEPPDWEPRQAWDVFVAPAHLGSDPYGDTKVQVHWEHCDGGEERTVLVLRDPDGLMAGVPVEMIVVDPLGDREGVLNGTTDSEGKLTFDHRYDHRGRYRMEIVLGGEARASIPVVVGSVPDHLYIDHSFAISTAMALLALGLAALLAMRRVRRGG